jgi:Fe-coproporphyrin III synthase
MTATELATGHVHGPQPVEAIVALTYRCDARCTMCNIWQMRPQEGLTVADYAKLPSSIRQVNITGGEALMRKDFTDVALTIYEACDHPRMVISTNGFQPDRSVRILTALREQVPDLGVGISFDGIGETHTRIRGVKEAFEKSLKTLTMLQDAGFTDLRIGFTAMPENVGEMPAVYDLARSLGVDFATTVAQNSEIYYQTETNEPVDPLQLQAGLEYVNQHELRSGSPKRWFRAYFNSGILTFVRDHHRISACHAGRDFFYLSPEGELYPCLTIPRSFGHLGSASFDDVWNSEAAALIRRDISGCEECWMMCTARTELKRQLPRALAWVATNKVRSHARPLATP